MALTCAANKTPATAAITSIMAGPSHNASLVSLAYSYGSTGHTTGAYDVLTQAGYQLNTLSYDNLNRLTSAPIHNSAGTHARSASYGPGGNITSRTGVGSYAYSAAMPHAVTKTTLNGIATHYAYNSVGEMTSGAGLSQIQWSRGGRATKLIGTQTTQLKYGAGGQLVQKTVGATTSRYFGKLFVKVGNAYRERIVANGQVIALVNVNAAGVTTTDYLIHDAQGSPAAILGSSGSLVARFAFNAWGELVNPQTGTYPDPNASTKQALTTLGYTGHEMLWQAGLVHTWARLYNPHLGRWLSPDPTVPNPYNGQSFNRYSYVLNSPMTFVDPLGLMKYKLVCDDDGNCQWVAILDRIFVTSHCPICDAIRRMRQIQREYYQHLWDYLHSLSSQYAHSFDPGGFVGWHGNNHSNQHKKVPPCGSGSSSPNGGTSSGNDNVATHETINGATAFVSIVEKAYLGTDATGDAFTAYVLAKIGQYTFGATINAGLYDIRFWQSTGMHGPTQGGIIDWHTRAVPWQNYGGKFANELGSREALKLNQYTTLSCYFQSN